MIESFSFILLIVPSLARETAAPVNRKYRWRTEIITAAHRGYDTMKVNYYNHRVVVRIARGLSTF